MTARLITAVIAGCTVAMGCGDGAGSGDDGESGAVQTATAYVEAIDERDGDTFCELVAPYISGTLELEIEDPDSDVPRGVGDCGEFVSGFIGYIEDCCPPEFVGASVAGAKLGERDGRLQAVDLEIELETKDEEQARTETLRDVVWLAQFDGEWRVAKLSAVARAASLGFHIGDETQEDDPLAAPDLDAQIRMYAAKEDESAQQAEDREASYGRAGKPTSCGGLEFDDPAGDARDYQFPAPKEPPPPTPSADLREVQLSARDGGFCVRYVTAGEIEGPVTFNFNLRDAASGEGFIQTFDAELRDDGLVRVTSGEDDEGHPVPVPAEVGLADNELTMVLTRESLAAGDPSPHSTGPAPTDRFAFMASVTAPLGEERTLHDDLGRTETATAFTYPKGTVCQLMEC